MNTGKKIAIAQKHMRERRWRWQVVSGAKKILVGTALVVTACLSMGVMDDPPYRMMEEVYTVQEGDTLCTIGKEYMKKNTYGEREIREFIEGIKQINEELVHGQVEPGQILKITWWEAK